MLLKRQAKNKLYDILHHGTVYVCMGVTVLATAYLGWSGYRYFTVIRPQMKRDAIDKIKAADLAAANADGAEILKA